MQQRKRKEKSQKISRLTFKLAILTAIFYVITLMVIGVFLPQDTISAAAVIDTGGGGPSISSQWGPTDTAESYVLYGALTACIKSDNWSSAISSSDASAGKWFDNPRIGATNPRIGYFLTGMNSGLNTGGNGENVGCGGDNIGWIGAAAKLWGYDDPLGLLCDIGATTYSGRPCNHSGEKYSGTRDPSKFHTNVSGKIGTTNPPTLSDPANYVLYSSAFKGGCLGPDNLQPWTNTADSGNEFYYKNVTMIDRSGNSTTANYMGIRTTDESIWVYTDPTGNDHKFKCSELVTKMNQYAPAYQAATLLTPDVPSEPPETGADRTGGTNNDTCGSQVTGIGWIICPVLSALTHLDDGMWTLVSGLLTVNPLNQTDPIYQAWGSIRSIANVLFVLFFLVIIFSQLSGIGITNYGVKKLLPKVIIAAILVNVSFIIIQLGVDIFNIVGSSLYSFIVGMAPEYGVNWGSALDLLAGGFAGAGAVAVAVATAGGPIALFFLLLGVAAIGALGLFTAVLTLIFRQAAIIILAILAPLAFVAYLLPNTESWFKKWRGLLMSMLMMYPLAALVFAGAQFAAATIIGQGNDFWNICIGLIIMALPLFSLPFIARQGGPMLSRVNGALRNVTSRANQPISNWSKSHADAAAADFRNDNGNIRGGVLGGLQRVGRGIVAPSRHLNRAFVAGRQNREAKTQAARDEFASQINNNEVRGVFGRRIKKQDTDVRAASAKEQLGVDATNTTRRMVEQNPNVNARHGGRPNGEGINEAKYVAGLEKEGAENRRDEGLSNNLDFDTARRSASHAKSDAKTAENEAAGRVERDPTTLRVRLREGASETALKAAQAPAQQLIAEAGSRAGGQAIEAALLPDATVLPNGTVIPVDAAAAEAARQEAAQISTTIQQGHRTLDTSASATQSANDVRLEEYQADLVADEAGGHGSPSATAIAAGGIDPHGIDRVIGGALHGRDETNAKHVAAAASRISHADLPRDQLRTLAQGGPVPGTGLDGADLATQQAAIEQMVAANDVGGMASIWDNVDKITAGMQADEATQLRNTFAAALMRSSGKPAYYPAGAIEAMRIADSRQPAPGTNVAIGIAIDQNRYSPEKIVGADNDELGTILQLAQSGNLTADQIRAMQLAATTALTDDRLNVRISRNRDNIEALAALNPYEQPLPET